MGETKNIEAVEAFYTALTDLHGQPPCGKGGKK